MNKPDWLVKEEKKALAKLSANVIDHLPIKVFTRDGELTVLSAYKSNGFLCIDVGPDWDEEESEC